MADHFAEEIVAGRLDPGEPFPPEAEIVAQFQLSKVVVRESIETLRSVGLLRVRQGRRTTVLDESHWDVLSPTVQQAFERAGRGAELVGQVYEARLLVEPEMAALAASRCSTTQRERLAELASGMGLIATKGDVEAFLVADRELHDALARSVGNLALRAMVRDLHLMSGINFAGSKIEARDLGGLAAQHEEIVTAVVAGDAPRARLAMQAHLGAARRLELSREKGATRRRR